MPVQISRSDGGYRVSTPNGVKAKHTTLEKAKKQRRLLNAIDHGFVPSKGGVSRRTRVRKYI